MEGRLLLVICLAALLHTCATQTCSPACPEDYECVCGSTSTPDETTIPQETTTPEETTTTDATATTEDTTTTEEITTTVEITTSEGTTATEETATIPMLSTKTKIKTNTPDFRTNYAHSNLGQDCVCVPKENVEDVRTTLYIVSGVLGGACFILIVASVALGVMYARGKKGPKMGGQKGPKSTKTEDAPDFWPGHEMSSYQGDRRRYSDHMDWEPKGNHPKKDYGRRGEELGYTSSHHAPPNRYPSREERWDAEDERAGRRESRLPYKNEPRVEGGGAGGRPTYGSAWEPIPRVHERYPTRRQN